MFAQIGSCKGSNSVFPRSGGALYTFEPFEVVMVAPVHVGTWWTTPTGGG